MFARPIGIVAHRWAPPVLAAGAVLASCTLRVDPDSGPDVMARPDVPLVDVPTLRDVPAMPGDAPDSPLLDAPALDAPAVDAPDASLLDVPSPRDIGVDAPSDAPGSDAGPALPTIDGTIAPGEWAAATATASSTPTAWTGNELRGLRVLITADALYIAVEGRIEGGNAIAVYVDRDRDEAVGVASLATLTDDMDALDAAITAALVTPASFATDLVFGTLDMARSATGSDPRMGWRDLVRAGSPADLYWITAPVAPVACSASACETRLPRTEMGGVAPVRLGVFARIVNADGSMSPNQTLPMDDAASPRTVSVVLEIAE